MIRLRKAVPADLDYLVRTDLMDEAAILPEVEMTSEEKTQHREKIAKFVSDPSRGAWIFEEEASKRQIAAIVYSIANRDQEYPWKTIYHELERSLFQEDGRFIEIFNLWVEPEYRRLGLATKLKQQLEEEARERGIDLIYTHTQYDHVIELNKKLGYTEVRRGPIWDSVIRVSLVKSL
ncbi:GNAT family N-acetyltransferase [Paenibacillus sp. RC67]|uniref:GNAT family N-acetyltransferase n=1 Tax=Paenibacillus sp. RC67 TaxID=3039392 RepID=UPI0024AD4DCC|nr:GNAT family N-acetyltransferase [Paenibacillus sp. RC67]